MLKDFQEILRQHFELEERELLPRLQGTQCSHARSLAARHPDQVSRLQQLLSRAGALAWDRRRASLTLHEFFEALVGQFKSEESGLHDEVRRHLIGERNVAGTPFELSSRACHGV